MEFDLRDPDGKTGRSAINIAQPYPIAEDQWACPVDLGTPYGRTADIMGISSMQALRLAMAFIGTMVAALIDKGYHFLQNGEPLAMDALLWMPDSR